MKILVIGAEGQLGTELCQIWQDEELHRADLDGSGYILDIRQEKQVHELIAERLKPDVVVNAAAAHDLPRCEKDPVTAFAVNATGCMHLAKACAAANAQFIHVSTDYVFGSGGTEPYVETDLPAPLNVYAASKLAGEHLASAYCDNSFIIRTAALYGKAPCRSKGGRNFVQMMLHLAATRPEVKVVTDEVTTPTYTGVLAKQIRWLSERGDPGLYHATCEGECSWFEFAQAIFEEMKLDVKLVATSSAEFQSPVQRPDYSVLENRAAKSQGLDIMPEWRKALEDYLEQVDTVEIEV